MKNLKDKIKKNPAGVNLMLEKLRASSPEFVKRLDQRDYSSRGDGSGCENTHFSSVWDSWNDKK